MAQVAPQGSTSLAIPRNVLIDAFVADASLSGDLLRAPVLDQTSLHHDPVGWIDAGRELAAWRRRALCRFASRAW